MSERVVWEQRWHPFREEWVLFTSHRAGRPWSGETRAPEEEDKPAYDPQCYLCPGNARIRGHNPPYDGVYWFPNDLPTFSDESPKATPSADPLYRTRPALGAAEVLCYHPDHSKTFADLELEQAAAVVEAWRDRSIDLAARDDVQHVLIFENKGAAVGTSNPHPHCQIYAGNLIYAVMAAEREAALRHHADTGESLLLAVVERESASPRVVAENEHFLVCVPWFARYAYETHILPKRQVADLAGLEPRERWALAEMLREIAIRYDNLWRMPMPYVMAVHQAPCDGVDNSSYPFHVEFHPPLRTPDTMKYLAGPEIGGGSMTNESDPDQKAAELRAVSSTLYRASS